MPTATEDRDEILQLLYRYNHAIDNGDAEGWADTFTPDAVFDAAGNLMSGREALVAFAASVHGARHVVANPVVDIAGDTATVRARTSCCPTASRCRSSAPTRTTWCAPTTDGGSRSGCSRPKRRAE